MQAMCLYCLKQKLSGKYKGGRGGMKWKFRAGSCCFRSSSTPACPPGCQWKRGACLSDVRSLGEGGLLCLCSGKWLRPFLQKLLEALRKCTLRGNLPAWL